MGFFEYYFKLDKVSGEETVPCPFPHHTHNGLSYQETHPSAHVNLTDRVYHCKVCCEGYNEITFMTKLLGCTYGGATKLSKAFNNSETLEEWCRTTALDASGKQLASSLGISDEVCAELHIANPTTMGIAFPVFMYKKLVDIRTYTPDVKPKLRSRVGAPSGVLVHGDELQSVPLNKTILICAGEKDMATTRSHGFKAYTLTGGEMALPISTHWFRDRNVVIVYDNDDAGRKGAVRLATWMLEIAASVKICNKFHEVCIETSEDMTDFWNKYHGTKEQLIQMMDATPQFTQEDAIKESVVPMVTLSQATSPKYINKLVRSNIQVVAVSEAQYVVPTCITAEKTKETSKDNRMYEGEVREWYLTENTVQDILHLTDGGFKEDDIMNNIKKLLGISDKERYVRITKQQKSVVYKGYVTDMFEAMNTDEMPMEYTCYSIDTRLESGKKYLCTYKLVPHPYKGQQLIMLIMNAIPANDSVSNFKITRESIQRLAVFQNAQGTVKERIQGMVSKVKGLLGYNGNNTLIEVIDLAYHTVLAFNLGQFKNVRGYLDTLIVGESRVGKSSTADQLRKTYQLGTFTSLAGNSATIPGLIGGSNKTAGGAMQTKAGLIPQNHKGLIIFEEFGKCKNDLITELTDIRSSNEVRITRVSGTLTLPAMVRMIALSNVRANGSDIKPIASYPNGLAIVTELVPTAEDIARYDILCVLGDKGTSQIDPYWHAEEPYPAEAYQTRVRWVWSRTPDQVIISDEVGKHIIELSNLINSQYDCHIKVFGTECWKKLARLSIAVAGYLVSTDETYQTIVVLEEHVDYAASLFIDLYDNPTFRLKEYVANERKYSTIDAAGIALLQDLYIKAPQLLLMLEQEAAPTRNTLMAAVGLSQDTYNGLMSMLIRGAFVKMSGQEIVPTERFRLGMSKLNRSVSVVRVGEPNA